MASDHRAKLRAIKRFDQLINYLRDEMGWPIERNSTYDDITFEYLPEELGIDSSNAAKVKKIGSLRPFKPNQPWGILFVEFERKRLPVLALRRILSQIVLKKRASANNVERAAFATDDLLFISSYGESDERQISFAHFAQTKDGKSLPTLKVLGWDNRDTTLHLDAVARELTRHLSWPGNVDDAEAWRSQWRSAFTLEHREVITTSKELSVRLAELARIIRDRISNAIEIETDTGPLTRLMKDFKMALVHDLDSDGFADMYAQTITHGLLSARFSDPSSKTFDDFAAHMRTNPFLRDLMETFLRVGGRGRAGHTGIDFDELGVSEVVKMLDAANMEAVARDFDDRNPQEDPVIIFYERFLTEYDPKIRAKRGVFYTPRSVVSYIVRSVHELLRTDFGLPDGLADVTTWGEMAKRHKGLTIPDGVSPDQDFIQILDPATGTGTFLVETIDLIHKTLVTKWEGEGRNAEEVASLWNDYVPKHLLTRLHGYELLMAPYAVAHLKIGIKLYETGYRFGSNERSQVYLTNALEPAAGSQLTLDLLPALAHEAKTVNQIKEKRRFTVVIGNPPYSGHSSNPARRKGSLTYAGKLIERYFFFDGKPLGERQPKWLHDDYVKFTALAESEIIRSGSGICGFITNHGFIRNTTFRGMRQSLLSSLPRLWVLDLEGSVKKESRGWDGKDENVFDIEQGTAITLAIRGSLLQGRTINYASIRGTRDEKYKVLLENNVFSLSYLEFEPRKPFLLFNPTQADLDSEWYGFPSLHEIMPHHALGVVTGRDDFAIDMNKTVLLDRIKKFCNPRNSDRTIANLFSIRDAGGYVLEKRRKVVLGKSPSSYIKPINYRPFDSRFVAYSRGFLTADQSKIMSHLGTESNIALATTRAVETGRFDHVFCTRLMMGHHFVSLKESNYAFPLFMRTDKNVDALQLVNQSVPNLSPNFVSLLKSTLPQEEVSVGMCLPHGLQPEDIFNYAYAIFHSPGYRSRFNELLVSQFPRLPLTSNLILFRALARLGGLTVSLHLLEAPDVQTPISQYVGPRAPEIERVSWSANTVWIDKAQTVGFKGVSEQVWNFRIGGYQVCDKWLKDRKGRKLLAADIAHYQKVIVALSETISLMSEIDEVIEQHGGWPDAFQSSSTADKALLP